MIDRIGHTVYNVVTYLVTSGLQYIGDRRLLKRWEEEGGREEEKHAELASVASLKEIHLCF